MPITTIGWRELPRVLPRVIVMVIVMVSSSRVPSIACLETLGKVTNEPCIGDLYITNFHLSYRVNVDVPYIIDSCHMFCCNVYDCMTLRLCAVTGGMWPEDELGGGHGGDTHGTGSSVSVSAQCPQQHHNMFHSRLIGLSEQLERHPETAAEAIAAVSPVYPLAVSTDGAGRSVVGLQPHYSLCDPRLFNAATLMDLGLLQAPPPPLPAAPRKTNSSSSNSSSSSDPIETAPYTATGQYIAGVTVVRQCFAASIEVNTSDIHAESLRLLCGSAAVAQVLLARVISWDLFLLTGGGTSQLAFEPLLHRVSRTIMRPVGDLV